ncbi:MAG: prepilin-type N-terminal cleavage/methylation domain-containing protein [Patescibacteria group bacterium]
MKNIKRGFTLIELLVVIAIIGILSSVVLASLNSARAKSRDAKRLSDIKSLQLALELYFDQNKEYSSSLDELVTEEYIGQKPNDPLGAEYVYDVCGTDNDGYHLGASLENNIPEDYSDVSFTCTGGSINFGSDSSACSSAQGQGGKCYDVTD